MNIEQTLARQHVNRFSGLPSLIDSASLTDEVILSCWHSSSNTSRAHLTPLKSPHKHNEPHHRNLFSPLLLLRSRRPLKAAYCCDNVDAMCSGTILSTSFVIFDLLTRAPPYKLFGLQIDDVAQRVTGINSVDGNRYSSLAIFTLNSINTLIMHHSNFH